MTLTCVMAHARFDPGRRAMLPDVLASWDGRVDLVVADDERMGAWAVVRDCWREAAELAGSEGHILIAQDDFLMAKGGAEYIEALCDLRPNDVMAFRWAQISDEWHHQWVVDENALWGRSMHAWTGGSLAVPAKLIPEFLDWAEEFDARLNRVWPQHDDTRLELHLMSKGIETLRCRYSFLHHVGKFSICRDAVREDNDTELGLITGVSDLPPLNDARWLEEDLPSACYIPEAFKNTVDVLLGPRADAIGLGHLRRF